jgi:hypothetical protein
VRGLCGYCGIVAAWAGACRELIDGGLLRFGLHLLGHLVLLLIERRRLQRTLAVEAHDQLNPAGSHGPRHCGGRLRLREGLRECERLAQRKSDVQIRPPRAMHNAYPIRTALLRIGI